MRELSSQDTADRWASYYSQLADGSGDQKFKEEFDSYTYIHSWRNSVRIIAKMAHIKNNTKVLDAGCGWGRLLLGIVEQFNELDITAIDLQKEAIAKGEKLIGTENNTNKIDWRTGDLEDLPFEDNSFDSIYSARVFQHINAPEIAAKELFRVLKPGGQFLVFVQNKWCPLNLNYYSRVYSPPQIRNWFKDIPVKDLKVNTMDFYPSSMGSGALKSFGLTVENIMEKVPLLNLFGGKVLISGTK